MNAEEIDRRNAVKRFSGEILDYVKTIPSDFFPVEDKELDNLKLSHRDDLLPVFQYILEYHYSKWPQKILSHFMKLSFLVANETALAREDYPDLKGELLNAFRNSNGLDQLGLEHLMFGKGNIRKAAMADPVLKAKLMFCERNHSSYVPYENLLYTFLGSQAFEYFNLSSQEGRPKIQPHEVSREEWGHLLKIDKQVVLDIELQTLSARNPNQAKDMVVSYWAIFALLSYMSPSIFVAESDPYVSSIRLDGGLTVSTGQGTRVMPVFKPLSVTMGLEFLINSIEKTAFDASDLFWIACSFLYVNNVNVPYGLQVLPERKTFEIFLSHRGKDSKARLAKFMKSHGVGKSYFLDCFVIAESCINKIHIFRSVISSKSLFLIKTKGFYESSWCLKEMELARYLASKQIIDLKEFDSLDSAIKTLDGLGLKNDFRSHLFSSDEVPFSFDTIGPLGIINSDFNKEDRTPNRESLKEYSSFLTCLEKGLKHLFGVRSHLGHDMVEYRKVVLRFISELIKELQNSLKDPLGSDSDELITTFGMYVFGAFSIGSSTNSKVESRDSVDKISRITYEFKELIAREGPETKRLWLEYYCLIIAAISIDSNREKSNTFVFYLTKAICKQLVVLGNGKVLLDMRIESSIRVFRLRLAILLIKHGVGTIGIIQSSNELVHNTSIDDFPLSVLPCITVYPDMEGIIEETTLMSF